MRTVPAALLLVALLGGACAAPQEPPTVPQAQTQASQRCAADCQEVRARCLDAPAPPSPVAGSITGTVQPPPERDPQEQIIQARCQRAYDACQAGCAKEAEEEAAAGSE